MTQLIFTKDEPRIKKCPRCKRSYRLTPEFWCKDRHRSTGFKAHCKQCTRLKNRIHYHNIIKPRQLIDKYNQPSEEPVEDLVWHETINS